jgi:hypothetical protein
MPDAGDSLDPIEAARRGLERSREMLASVAGELDAHHRWFKSYLAEEEKKRKQHARRIKHHQAVLRRREGRKRAMRFARRARLVTSLAVRSAYRSVSDAASSTLSLSRDLLSGASAWAARTARVVASSAYKVTASGLSRSAVKAHAFILACAEAASALASSASRMAHEAALSAYPRMEKGMSSFVARKRALEQISSVAIAVSLSKAAAAARAVSLSATELLATSRSWLRATGSAHASSVQRAASSSSSWIATRARKLLPRLAGAASAIAASARRTAGTLNVVIVNRIALDGPRLRAYARRSSALAEKLPGQILHGLGRLQGAVILPMRRRVVSTAGGFGWQRWRLAIWEMQAAPPEADEEDHASMQDGQAGGRSTALALLEPWRSGLPAVRRAQAGRQPPAP